MSTIELPQKHASQPFPDDLNVSASTITTRMDAVERLTAFFKLERMVHLTVTSISLMALLLSAAILLCNGKAGTPEIVGLFGSSGLISYSAGRLLYMWNQALRLLAGDLIEKQ
jgi:hypothetical protein